MTRRMPGIAAPVSDQGASSLTPIVDVTLRVVTPMIGGGVESATIDPDIPVNGKSVRGHLRFWWRACNAHLYPDSTRLFQAEAAIWGQAATGKNASLDASAVWVEVDGPSAIRQYEVTIARPGWTAPGYPPHALWPFYMGETAPASTTGLVGFDFRVLLLSAHGRDVDATSLRQVVSAWIAFGGVGSRTRRGLGSLYLLSANDGYDYGWLANNTLDAGRLEVIANPYAPMLKGGRYILRNTPQDHIHAWSAAVQQLRIGRHPPDGDPRTPTYDREARADLGFPIPKMNVSREGNEIKRMASPIVAKAFTVSETQSRPLVLLLNAPHLFTDAVRYSHPPRDPSARTVRDLVLDHVKGPNGWGNNCREVTL